LGLVEMRAFEMPPHARMSLAQHLLLRGLVSKFWREPTTTASCVGAPASTTALCSPHFCETDFKDVLRDLRDAGYPFEFEWFAPHFEFASRASAISLNATVVVELRTALEPWHVLGEEPGGGGTVRYVDSSLERLQVKAAASSRPLRSYRERPPHPAASDRRRWRRRRRGALPRLAAS